MSLARRGVLFILSLLLLVGLLGTAFSVSSYLVLAKPSKVENELASSGFYTRFADNTIAQAETATGGSIGTEKINFNDPEVQQAARAALSQQFLQTQGNSFIESNYAWLQGKEAKPAFKVDLTPARQDFATKVGQAVTQRLASLPACTAAQTAQLAASTGVDPFTVNCRPATVDPATEGTVVAQEIVQSAAFTNNPVISPDTISSGNQPYYQKLSWAPQVYQASLKAPYMWVPLTLLLLAAVLLVARPKRKGIRRIGVVMLIAGILLLLNKLAADSLVNALQKQAINASNGNGQLQQAAVDFVHRIEADLVRIDLYFGIAFAALGLLITLLILAIRPRKTKVPAATPPYLAADQPAANPALDAQNFRTPQPQQPTVAPRPTQPGAPQLPPQPVRRKRPPHLIQ